MAVVPDPDCAFGETPHFYAGDLQTADGSFTGAFLGDMLEEAANIGGVDARYEQTTDWGRDHEAAVADVLALQVREDEVVRSGSQSE